MELSTALFAFAAALSVTLATVIPGLSQGKTAAAGIRILAENESQQTKGIIYAVMVETYALLAFVSYLIIANPIVF